MNYLPLLLGLFIAFQIHASPEEGDRGKVEFFEKLYNTKIEGVKLLEEYDDPDKFYSEIAKQVGIPKIALKAVEEKFGSEQNEEYFLAVRMGKRELRMMSLSATQHTMKTLLPFSFLMGLLLAGCRFEAPLVDASSQPIDPAAIGTWEPLQGQEKKDRIQIKKKSGTRYSMEYTLMADGKEPTWFFEGIPARLEGVSLVQLQIVASKGVNSEGKQEHKAKPGDRIYDYYSYEIKEGILEVRALKLDTHHKTTGSLKNAFRKQKETGDLFKSQPRRYRKITAE